MLFVHIDLYHVEPILSHEVADVLSESHELYLHNHFLHLIYFLVDYDSIYSDMENELNHISAILINLERDNVCESIVHNSHRNPYPHQMHSMVVDIQHNDEIVLLSHNMLDNTCDGNSRLSVFHKHHISHI